MTELREAAQQALALLQDRERYFGRCLPDTEVISALRSALAQEPAQPNNICTDCRNSDSMGLPDKPVCRDCVSSSAWAPLNHDSVNPNKPAAQEPTVRVHVYETTTGHGTFYRKDVTPGQLELKHGDKPVWLPLYTKSVRRLTEEQILNLALRHLSANMSQKAGDIQNFARAIEAAVLGEKP